MKEQIKRALEIVEHIEYLRILENGYKMRGVVVDSVAESVDTPENLELVRKLMKTDKIKEAYLVRKCQN